MMEGWPNAYPKEKNRLYNCSYSYCSVGKLIQLQLFRLRAGGDRSRGRHGRCGGHPGGGGPGQGSPWPLAK